MDKSYNNTGILIIYGPWPLKTWAFVTLQNFLYLVALSNASLFTFAFCLCPSHHLSKLIRQGLPSFNTSFEYKILHVPFPQNVPQKSHLSLYDFKYDCFFISHFVQKILVNNRIFFTSVIWTAFQSLPVYSYSRRNLPNIQNQNKG